MMIYQIHSTDGPARYGIIKTQDKTIKTPHLFYPHTTHLNPPPFAEAIIHQAETPVDYNQYSLCIEAPFFEPVKKTCETQPYLPTYLFYPKDVSNELSEKSLTYSEQHQEGKVIFLPADPSILTNFNPSSETRIYCVGSAQQLIRKPKTFTQYITMLRDQIGSENAIYLPLIADCAHLSLLCYMGVDCFNASSALLAARDGIYLFPTGNIHIDQLKTNPCTCPACQKTKNIETTEFNSILFHNYHILDSEIRLIQQSIQQKTLRELVEQRVRTYPYLTALLHILDMNHYTYLEQHTSTQEKNTIRSTTRDGLFRPEIIRFQQRLITRYQKPDHARILLLLPCSAKKPYSFSKTHKRFNRVIQSLKNHWAIHEMIITSPLGLVPRELELVYPASSYDIAVTGDWYEDEQKMICKQIRSYLDKNEYSAVVIHLAEDLQRIISSLVHHPYVTVEGNHPTSDEALHQLLQTLSRLLKNGSHASAQTRIRENIQALASYQFGPETAMILMKNTRIKGKYPYHRILDSKGKQLGMISPQRKFISLTLDGAKRLHQNNSYWVIIADDFTLKGSVFAPGVIDADSRIRAGDEVIVIQKRECKAVGVAQMNATSMKQRTYGEAVKIRHIHH